MSYCITLSFLFFCCISKSVFAAEDYIISEEQISTLLSYEKPIQVSLIWSRLDKKYEIINDFYLKDNIQPINKIELANHCNVKSLLPFLVNSAPICPLKLTVVARSLNLQESESVMAKSLILDKEALLYYGFIREI